GSGLYYAGFACVLGGLFIYHVNPAEEPKFEREYDEEELANNVNEKDLESS
ncbi:31717_t:CDS:1, partial [Racocetra persica]